MADTNQSIRTCILKVDLKCCTGCPKKVITKLQTISGVSGAEYNAEKGLMTITITGDVEPLTLVNKVTGWANRKTELVSVNYQLDDPISDDDDDEDESSSSETSSSPDPKTMEHQIQEKTNKKKKGLLNLFGCFSSKPKVVQPFAMQNRNWHVPSKFEHCGPSFSFPYGNHGTSQWPRPYPMIPPYPQMMPPYPPMMAPQQQFMQQQRPQAPMAGAVMQNNANMFPYGPQPFQKEPYFMSTVPRRPPNVNLKLHYPEKK
ncbi:hypothetical protein AALP_AA1G311600 [Arabis alpina]|uniref:HMA domain-containing protein n=1 Tax=Arabis alpina TaxID=50452 RepID=A0A087HRV6_ARAAL|nr:hypothetical protein AALP_AA1G311600 [Arabis alpina]